MLFRPKGGPKDKKNKGLSKSATKGGLDMKGLLMVGIAVILGLIALKFIMSIGMPLILGGVIGYLCAGYFAKQLLGGGLSLANLQKNAGILGVIVVVAFILMFVGGPFFIGLFVGAAACAGHTIYSFLRKKS